MLQGRIFDYQGNRAPVHAMIWLADIRLERAKRMFELAGTEAQFGFKALPHMDTRALQADLASSARCSAR
jgi:hypothetical protein